MGWPQSCDQPGAGRPARDLVRDTSPRMQYFYLFYSTRSDVGKGKEGQRRERLHDGGVL
ncbi:unnamed protein product [Nyctereutes procyonoides]|uniref:(raccoon dog) hypothetical protein n=1 Tax=Nyctereutes procyonoides TaxID=34880 RepID=A0A811YS03_NYCPR|nr:unnamed protein product [Nyctereutes procyonoides]